MTKKIGEDPGGMDIRVSNEAMEQFTAWFPDCNGIIDVDDARDALDGYGISSGEIYDLIVKLRSEGVEKFMPYCTMALRDHVEDMLTELDALGFNDPDAPVNGGDCIYLMNQYIPRLRSAVARDEKAVAFVEAICDCTTPDELWDFVQNNHDKIDRKVPASWVRAVAADDWDSIARMASVGFSRSFLKHLVDYMNGLLAVTPSLGALTELRVPFDGDIDGPYPVMVTEVEGKKGFHLGILGVLNGLLEALFGPEIGIAGHYDIDGKLVQFRPYIKPGTGNDKIKVPNMLDAETASPIKDVWAEDSNHSLEDWRYEVQNNDTRLGYWEWVASKKERSFQ